MKQKLVAFIALSLLFAQSDVAHSAKNIRRAGSTRRASTVHVTGTIANINATVAETTQVSTDYTKPAPITDAVAKKACDKMVIETLTAYREAVEKDPKKIKYKTASEAYAGLSFPKVNGNEANEVFCANFLENSVEKLWANNNIFTNKSEKACNKAKARAIAAERCWQFANAEKNNNPKFSEEQFNEYCGNDAISQIYNNDIPGVTDTTTADDFSDNKLPKLFSDVGFMGLNIAGYTRLLDWDIDLKTTEYPREVVQIVNSVLSQGKIACGNDFAATMHDTNFQLVDKTGSLERRIKEKGLLAGAKDWGVDQAGAIKGTNWANEVKAGTSEKQQKENNVKALDEAKDLLNEIDNAREITGGMNQIEGVSLSNEQQQFNAVREKLPTHNKIYSDLTSDQIDAVNTLKKLNEKIK